MNRFQNFFRKSLINYPLLLLVMLLGGCQTIDRNDDKAVEHSVIEHPSAPLPDVELTQDILTQILTAEIAVRAGQYEQAVDQLFEAAEKSSDPRLASKATYWALQSGLHQKAQLASQLWLTSLGGQPSSVLLNPRLALASSFLELDQPDQALTVYRQIVDDSPDGGVYKRIAGEMSRLQNSKKLTDVYQTLVSESDNAEKANVGLAILAARLNDYELSRNAIEQALIENPANEDAALIKLSYLFEDEDEQVVHNFANNYLEENPQGYRLRMEYARYLSNHADAEDAIEHYENVAANDDAMFEEATLSIVALAMQDEDYALADQNLERLLDHDPTDNRLILYRCQVQRELSNFDSASELCSEISFGEYYFPAQLEIGNVFADQDQIDKALAHLDNIPVSGAEEQIRVYMRQQRLLQQADELGRALTVLDKALLKYADNTSLLYARGLLLSELGKVMDHERDMRRLIKLEPENAHAYNALGYTLADLTSRYAEALELIKRAVELEPNDAYILDSLGWVYFKLEDFDNAKLHLEHAFELKSDAEIAAHLGEIYWILGDKTKAKSVWNKAIKQTPDNKVLNKTLERFL